MPISTLDVDPALCLLRPPVHDDDSLLRLLAARALEQGYVAETFADALVARERSFPTGLPTPVPAAIPHADPQHVLRPALAVALLEPPVEFGEMATDDRRLQCRLAVLLLVTTPQDQVDVLGRVIGALQRPDWPRRLAGAVDEADLAARFAALLT